MAKKFVTIGDLHREAGVDCFHLYGGIPIHEWHCSKCTRITSSEMEIEFEVTLGTWGPNGNGWNYWHKLCGGRMNPKPKTSAKAEV